MSITENTIKVAAKKPRRERPLDLLGQKFGRLTVTRCLGNKQPTGPYYWECLCACGKTHKARTSHLISGNIKSCGCLRGENMKTLLPTEHSAEYRLFYLYLRGAVRRKLPFKLTQEQCGKLFRQNCTYCGVVPNSIQKVPKCRSILLYNGIDRINSKEGYTKKNCVPCCTACNRAKNAMSVNQFIEWAKRLVAYQTSQ